MRRWLCAVLTIPLLLLCSCGKQPSEEQTALDLRAALSNADVCRMTALIHADCGGRLYDFALSCEAGEEETVTVLAPEEIAGVCAKVTEDGTELCFEDVSLSLGLGEEALSTPLLLPHLLLECLRSAYIADTARTDEGAVVRYYHGYGDDRLELSVTLDRAALTPLRCELLLDGSVIVSAEITEFTLQMSETNRGGNRLGISEEDLGRGGPGPTGT